MAKLNVKQITLMFALAGVEVSMQLEADYSDSTEDRKVLPQLEIMCEAIAKLPDFSPKGRGSKPDRPSYKGGAVGYHPLEELPIALSFDGRQKLCPLCKEPLFLKRGVAKQGKNAGKPYIREVHKVKTNCEYNYFLSDKEMSGL